MWARGLRSKLNLKRSTKMVLLCVKCANGMCSVSSRAGMSRPSPRGPQSSWFFCPTRQKTPGEPVDYQVEQKSQLDRGPKRVGLDIPALEIAPHWFLCVIPNQHGLTMPMHALFSMQELELWKLTSQGTVLSFCTQHEKWTILLLSWLH